MAMMTHYFTAVMEMSQSAAVLALLLMTTLVASQNTTLDQWSFGKVRVSS
jgi:hypothetical protein